MPQKLPNNPPQPNSRPAPSQVPPDLDTGNKMQEKIMKPFLLTMGYNYYPEAGTEDWKKCFETREAAEEAVLLKETYLGEPLHRQKCVYEGKEWDWYEIIDLRDWIF